jgi:hypothetical protein
MLQTHFFCLDIGDQFEVQGAAGISGTYNLKVSLKYLQVPMVVLGCERDR